jgi:hypothetical protein
MAEEFSPLFPNVQVVPQRPGSSVRAKLRTAAPSLRLQPSAPPKIDSKPVAFVAADAAAISAAARSNASCPAPPPSAPRVPVPGGPPNPTVTVRREGERITGIRIICTCGEVIDLECGY